MINREIWVKQKILNLIKFNDWIKKRKTNFFDYINEFNKFAKEISTDSLFLEELKIIQKKAKYYIKELKEIIDFKDKLEYLKFSLIFPGEKHYNLIENKLKHYINYLNFHDPHMAERFSIILKNKNEKYFDLLIKNIEFRISHLHNIMEDFKNKTISIINNELDLLEKELKNYKKIFK